MSADDRQPRLDALEQAQALLTEAIEEMHFLLHDLRPALLDDLGLISAVRRYTSTLVSDKPIELIFDTDGDPKPLPSQIETAIYRVAQEAVGNAIRHSGCDRIEVVFSYSPQRLLVSVTDNGSGFSRRDISDDSLGLMSMEERAKSVGGTFDVASSSSSANRGTSIRVEVPVAREAAGEHGGGMRA